MERENRVGPFRLRLEGIRVEGGHVIQDIEVMQPVQLAEHEARAEADRTPLAEIAVDAFRLAAETFSRLIQVPVVVEVVHAHLKSVFTQPSAELHRIAIGPLGDEVEG